MELDVEELKQEIANLEAALEVQKTYCELYHAPLKWTQELRAENDRLRKALAHFATDESPDGWIAIAALRGDDDDRG